MNNTKDIEKYFNLSLLNNVPNKENLLKDIEGILIFIDEIKKENITSFSSFESINKLNVFRPDEKKISGIEKAILIQAPDTKDSFFKVKKVL